MGYFPYAFHNFRYPRNLAIEGLFEYQYREKRFLTSSTYFKLNMIHQLPSGAQVEHTWRLLQAIGVNVRYLGSLSGDSTAATHT